eukprot:3153091-Rhodomonas_salina.2
MLNPFTTPTWVPRTAQLRYGHEAALKPTLCFALDFMCVVMLVSAVFGSLIFFCRAQQANSELVMVTGYTDIAKLAHTPTGEEGSGIYAFTLNSHSGKLTAEGSMQVSPNPAFLVKHPKLDI